MKPEIFTKSQLVYMYQASKSQISTSKEDATGMYLQSPICLCLKVSVQIVVNIFFIGFSMKSTFQFSQAIRNRPRFTELSRLLFSLLGAIVHKCTIFQKEEGVSNKV